MPATTPIGNYPYPLDPDPIDVPGDIQRLAGTVDADPGVRHIFPTRAAMNASWGPVDGAHAFTLDDEQEWLRHHGQWVRSGVGGPGAVPATGSVRVDYAAYGGGARSTLILTSLSDPNNLVTQSANTVVIDVAGVWTLNMYITLAFASGVGIDNRVDLAVAGRSRRWSLINGSFFSYYPLSYTGRFAVGDSFIWSGGGMPLNPSRLDLYPIFFTAT